MDMELEHGGDEDDRGSESSKGSSSASSDATVSSTASKLQALRLAEDLSMPSVCSLLPATISIDIHSKIIKSKKRIMASFGRVVIARAISSLPN